MAVPALCAGQGGDSRDQSVFVTRQDCARLVAHQASPDVTYKPGADVHGRYVPPADLPGAVAPGLPDRIQFDLKINPLAYGSQQSQATPGQKFGNTAAPVGHVEVDALSGAVKLNGQSLDGEQTRVVTEACRQAGYR